MKNILFVSFVFVCAVSLFATVVLADDVLGKKNLPDLVIRNLRLEQNSSVDQNESVLHASWCMKNRGNGTAQGALEVGFTLVKPSGEKVGGGVGVDGSLLPKQKMCFGASFPLDETGVYKVKVKADPFKRIVERKEKNNVKKKKFSFVNETV